METDTTLDFRSFLSNEEVTDGMSTSDAWDLYLRKVKGKINSELKDFVEVQR